MIAEFTGAGVEACLVALDLETTVATPPCDNAFRLRRATLQGHPR